MNRWIMRGKKRPAPSGGAGRVCSSGRGGGLPRAGGVGAGPDAGADDLHKEHPVGDVGDLVPVDFGIAGRVGGEEGREVAGIDDAVAVEVAGDEPAAAVAGLAGGAAAGDVVAAVDAVLHA